MDIFHNQDGQWEEDGKEGGYVQYIFGYFNGSPGGIYDSPYNLIQL